MNLDVALIQYKDICIPIKYISNGVNDNCNTINDYWYDYI